MNYEEARHYIDEKGKLGIVPGLENITELLSRLGNPQNQCRCLHIAGTNGKGSVFAFLEAMLLAAELKVGRYVSPTIFRYLERFQINQQDMTEIRFAEYVSRVSKVIASMEEDGFKSPTAFEIETAIAFLYFADEKVDYALIECGMGGRLDATNVILAPILSVFATISMDHMQFLGDSLTAIASEKAGIIRTHGTVVSSMQKNEVQQVLSTRCKEQEATFEMVCNEDIEIQEMTLSGTKFLYEGNAYEISLLGEHQVMNAVTALLCAKQLPELTEDAKAEGLHNAKWPGRLTKVSENPPIFVDGAHNEDAWKKLRSAVNKYFTNKHIIYIIGVLKDKEYEKMIELLGDRMDYAIVITPDTPRGLKKEVLADLICRQGIPVVTADSAEDAITKAKAQVTDESVILVCGSLSFIFEYLNMR